MERGWDVSGSSRKRARTFRVCRIPRITTWSGSVFSWRITGRITSRRETGVMIRGLLPWFVLAGVLGAQRPARPALGPGQDTNSADAYVALGISQMMDHPKVAAAAFFWATRLDPANGDAWYGRWAARLLDPDTPPPGSFRRSEEHTSELQSHVNLVCRLL